MLNFIKNAVIDTLWIWCMITWISWMIFYLSNLHWEKKIK